MGIDSNSAGTKQLGIQQANIPQQASKYPPVSQYPASQYPSSASQCPRGSQYPVGNSVNRVILTEIYSLVMVHQRDLPHKRDSIVTVITTSKNMS